MMTLQAAIERMQPKAGKIHPGWAAIHQYFDLIGDLAY